MAPRADLWRFVRPLVLVTVALVGLGLLVPATAQAGTPLPREDRFDVYAGSTIRLDVLANDGVLGNGTLTVCEVNVADRDTQVIYAGADTDRVLVDIRPFTQGRLAVHISRLPGRRPLCPDSGDALDHQPRNRSR